MYTRLIAAYTVGLVLLITVPSYAQETRQPPTSEECVAAATSLRTSSPPDMFSKEWALSARCGARGGAALAAAARGLATESDTSRIHQAEVLLRSIRDAQVFEAMLALAGNTGATSRARSLALRVLLAAYNQNIFFDNPPLFVPEAGRCRQMGAQLPPPHVGASLPTDYLRRANAMSEQLIAAAGTPADVRLMARCVRGALRHAVPSDVDPELIELVYVCGRKFTVRNLNPDGVAMQYDVQGTADHGDFGVRGNQEFALITRVAGTTRLFHQGRRIASAANPGTACP